MATQQGYQLSEWLKERGWELLPLPHGVKGDPQARDPNTGEQVSLYEAVARHKDRSGESPESTKGEVT